jgi:OOP family OmpA-OmpF porin
MSHAVLWHQKEPMTILNAPGLIGLVCIGASVAAPALSQDSGYYYGGVSVGESRTDVDPSRQTSDLLPGVSAATASTDNKDTAYRLFGGYQFHQNMAVEAGFFNLGHSTFTAVTVPAGSLAGRTKVQGVNLDLVGTLPLTEQLSLLGRVGVQRTRSTSSFGGTGAAAGVVDSQKHNGNDYKVGVGVQYAFHPGVWLRAELERYRVKGAVSGRNHVNLLSVSLVFPFGYPAAKRSMATMPPEPRMPMGPVAAAPVLTMPIAPVVVPAPATPRPIPQRVSLSADTLFGSNQHGLRDQGKATLDRFVQQLSGTSYESIRVDGHTDRMGSPAANQVLSERRATSVKDHLMVNGRIDPARIVATGKGENLPATAVGDCPDRLPRAQLIDCLQPDRRVEIEVTGTR